MHASCSPDRILCPPDAYTGQLPAFPGRLAQALAKVVRRSRLEETTKRRR